MFFSPELIKNELELKPKMNLKEMVNLIGLEEHE